MTIQQIALQKNEHELSPLESVTPPYQCVQNVLHHQESTDTNVSGQVH